MDVTGYGGTRVPAKRSHRGQEMAKDSDRWVLAEETQNTGKQWNGPSSLAVKQMQDVTSTVTFPHQISETQVTSRSGKTVSKLVFGKYHRANGLCERSRNQPGCVRQH
jgi:hypothetical protein